MKTAPIVVGVDGSASAQHAIQWALREAEARKCAVHAVHVWMLGPMADFTWHGPRRLRQDSRSLLRHAVEHARKVTGARPEVVRISVQGGVARSLVDAARGAAMLVLGGDPGLTFGGSVRTACVRDAEVTVVVIPAEGPIGVRVDDKGPFAGDQREATLTS